jgi:hypothetical protein
MGKALAGAGHRVHRSSRYAALRAAADGTYGFSACVMPLELGERSVADAIVALLPDARVAIATDDAAVLPERLPAGFISFPRADFRTGRLPRAWLDALAQPDNARPDDVASEPSSSNRTTGVPKTRSDATRRLRGIATARRAETLDARALLEDELAWYRASGIGFALIGMRVAGALQPLRTTAAESLRAGDSLAIADGELVIILPAADGPQAAQICARVVKRMLKAQRHLKTGDVRTGIAVCPHDGDSAAALLAKAREHA